MAITTYSKLHQGAHKVGRYFCVREFACRDGADKVMIDSVTVEFLDKIREHFGKPVSVISGYRTPEYNARIDGSKNSYHMKGQAADIEVQGVHPSEVAKFAESIGVPGIGLYDYGNGAGFVHIDSRKSKYYWKQTAKNAAAKAVSTFGGASASVMPTIKNGSKGDAVKTWQGIIGVKTDGAFGSKTLEATKAWQKARGLTADGIVGKLTWAESMNKEH